MAMVRSVNYESGTSNFFNRLNPDKTGIFSLFTLAFAPILNKHGPGDINGFSTE